MRDGDVGYDDTLLVTTERVTGTSHDGDADFAISLIVPHDGAWEAATRVPELRDFIAELPPKIARVAEIDRDVGAHAVARATAQRLVERDPRFTVQIVRHEMPRILVDAERQEIECAMGGFVPRGHSVCTVLQTMHDDLINATTRACRSSLFSIMVHTMSPFTPDYEPKLTMESLMDDSYTSAWLEAAQYGKRRQTNFIYDEAMPRQRGLLAEFQTAFSSQGMPYVANHDYAWGRRLTTCSVVEDGCHAFIVDAPKDLIAQGAAVGITANLDRIALDNTKIMRYADLLATGSINTQMRLIGASDYVI